MASLVNLALFLGMASHPQALMARLRKDSAWATVLLQDTASRMDRLQGSSDPTSTCKGHPVR